MAGCWDAAPSLLYRPQTPTLPFSSDRINSHGVWNETGASLWIFLLYCQRTTRQIGSGCLLRRRPYCAALGTLSNACSSVAGAREEIPRLTRDHACPGFRCRPQGQSHFPEQRLARLHRIEPRTKLRVQVGRRRFYPDDLKRVTERWSEVADDWPKRWTMKRGFGADRMEPIAGFRRASGRCAMARGKIVKWCGSGERH